MQLPKRLVALLVTLPLPVVFAAGNWTGIAPAVRDFADLKTVIDGLAKTLWEPVGGPNRTGKHLPVVPYNTGSSELLSNLTGSILAAKWKLNTDQAGWLNITFSNDTVLPSLDYYYMRYVESIPNLAGALTALGRAWHLELNRPVYISIDALQATLSAFSASLLTQGLIHSNSTLRTIRATRTLEDAQQAWSKILNFPGTPPQTVADVAEGASQEGITFVAGKRGVTPRYHSRSRSGSESNVAGKGPHVTVPDNKKPASEEADPVAEADDVDANDFGRAEWDDADDNEDNEGEDVGEDDAVPILIQPRIYRPNTFPGPHRHDGLRGQNQVRQPSPKRPSVGEQMAWSRVRRVQ